MFDHFAATAINFTTVSEATTMYLIVHGVVAGLHWVLKRGERSYAILMHYQHQVMGQGHQNDSVLSCHQDHCAVFSRA